MPEPNHRNGKLQILNSDQAAQILGVNVSSIKRWSDSGDLVCQRTKGGHRRFSLDDLIQFSQKQKRMNSKSNLFDLNKNMNTKLIMSVFKKEFDYIIDYLFREAISGSQQNIQQILIQLYTTKSPLWQIYEDVLVPVLHLIGDKWKDNELTPIGEHIATQKIRDSIIRLQGLVKGLKRKQQSILFLNPANELHDIGLKMAEHIMEERGFQTYYSGQITPANNLKDALKHFGPDIIIVASTFVEHPEKLRQETDAIWEAVKNRDIQLYVAGNGFDEIILPESSSLVRLHSLRELVII
ncbi:helix-turn-helix domain-containing protein [candidate division KSB1 bacterium]|nr:helix-turn-helix domain-containing protein [candidate division KSB1 bacterium]